MLAAIAVVAVVLVAAVLWLNRWRLGLTAVKIVDPMVRAWVANQVLASSDNVYHLSASTIQIDEAHQRIVIDTITLTTDTIVNNRLARPHPAMLLRFSRCALTGIDFELLTAGHGLHAAHGGCDSVMLSVKTLAVPIDNDVAGAGTADSNNFLRFQRELKLPGMLPHFGIDLLEFPHVHVAFDLLGVDGRRSTLSVDSLSVQLDSTVINPHEPIARRRPLFSRDITVRLDRFESRSREAGHVSLQHLRANLEDGTCSLDSVVLEPADGRRADSIGFSALRARHLALAGINWRRFLGTGDVDVGRLEVDTMLVRSVAPTHLKARVIRLVSQARHVEATLRDVGRRVRLDSLVLTALTMVEAPARRSDSIVTTIHQLRLSHTAFGPDGAGWNTPLPIGPVTLQIVGLLRRSRPMNIAVARLSLDATAKRIVADSIHAAPEGDDSAFQRRERYRKSRVSITMARVEARGIDLPAYLARGALRAQHLDVTGLMVDVMKDKSKPEDPAPDVIRRTPQGVLRDDATEIQIDTVTGAGLVIYRERDSTAASHGTLTFGALQVRGFNFSTDSTRMSRATPFRLVGDAKLMGAGALHVEWSVPLLDRQFDMQWHGTLGPMDPKAMNPFIVNALGMRFSGGEFEGGAWDATVVDGTARGKLVSRWHNFQIELPGVARNDSSVVGGIKRGLAKFAANAFGIHGDNDSTGGHHPRDASITHRWINTETLPQFIWFQLRDPLVLLLRK